MNFFKNTRNVVLLSVIGVLLIGLIIALAVMLPGSGDDTVSTPSTATSSVQTIVSTPESSEPSSSEPSSDTTSSEEVPVEPEEIKLSVTAPKSADITVNTASFTVRGSGDPDAELLLNGEPLELDENGIFSKEVTLTEGANTFTFTHKGEEKTFTVRYKKIIIKSISPSGTKTVDSQDTLVINCTALRDSTVTATFNGKSVKLYSEDSEESAGEYVSYAGSITMPLNTSKDKSYGKITFKAVNSSGTATKSSGNITVKKFDIDKYDGGNGYPKNSGYLNVGTTHIAEVIVEQGETYSVSDATALSRPTNNYLPKGTVDYCSPYLKKYQSDGKNIETVNLRYGNKMHTLNSRGKVDVKIYEGTLPETNKINVASYEDIGKHTLLTLDVDWKAPFRFEIGPQKYTSTSASNRDYTYSEATFNYIDITFCYADEVTSLPDFSDDPLFASCELIEGTYDTTLRIYLKQTGIFYGWSAEYNEQGQLCFKFLKPTELKAAENEYGYSLEGVTIVIDAGHGGRDNGASGFKKEYPEDALNLTLALELEAQLKALGANVVMTRTDDSYIEIEDRFSAVWDNDPDLVISVHRNAASREYPNSFASYHFNPYTKSIAEYLLEASLQSGVYEDNAWSKVKWHVFFLSRVSDCPSVLTENGFMTNKKDYANMLDPEQNKKSAEALTKGIMNYFISMQKDHQAEA